MSLAQEIIDLWAAVRKAAENQSNLLRYAKDLEIRIKELEEEK